ncbi:unnamed protein product, partial [Mesorhabditis belari]|uniref:C-type lectin domain-containing protein n=1 Tax=Mesorhabditis belari TaxID=2138241 RepID=A0AAF3EEE9_9BILA
MGPLSENRLNSLAKHRFLWFILFIFFALYSLGSIGFIVALSFSNVLAKKLHQQADMRSSHLNENLMTCSRNETCENKWNHYVKRDICYKKFEVKLGFDEAEKLCVSFNANLLSIHNEEEGKYFARVFTEDFDDERIWIGLMHSQGQQFHWTDESEADFAKFMADHNISDAQNQDRVQLELTHDEKRFPFWTSNHTTTAYFICSKKS